MTKEDAIKVHKLAVSKLTSYFQSQGYEVRNNQIDFDENKDSYMNNAGRSDHYHKIHKFAETCEDYKKFCDEFPNMWDWNLNGVSEKIFNQAITLSEEEFVESCCRADVLFGNFKRGDISIRHPVMSKAEDVKVVGGMNLSYSTFCRFKGTYVAFYDWKHPELTRLARRKNVRAYFEAILRGEGLPTKDDTQFTKDFSKYVNWCAAKDLTMYWTQMALLNAEDNFDNRAALAKAYFAKQLPRGAI